MAVPSSNGYFEAYPSADATTIEIYRSQRDFHEAHRGRITLHATDADPDHQGQLGNRAWQVVLVVGALAVAGYFLTPHGLAQDVVYSGVGFVSTLCLLWAVRLHRPGQRSGWYLLAIANAFFVAGDAVLDFYDVVLHAAAPFPSVADALYLAGYPFLFAGVFQVRGLRRAPGPRESKADAAMVCIGALALSGSS